MNFEYIGLAAGLCSTIGFFPQVIKAMRTRSTGDLSILMVIILLTGVVLWLVYGIIIHDRPIIIANGMTAIMLAIMLFLKLKYH